MKKNDIKIISILFIILLITAYYYKNYIYEEESPKIDPIYDINSIPDYYGESFIILNNNEPLFDNITDSEFEIYSDLDKLGRCGAAFANVSESTMPTEKRGKIGSVKPTGWQTVKYDFIEGKYLYNRCHLLGYQLTGENANPKNLITCTREMNTGKMLEYENKIAMYVRETGNHVMYRVTPIFDDDNLVAKGAIMEGYSVEDEGEGIKFNIFVYNVQSGIIIDYKTGDSLIKVE